MADWWARAAITRSLAFAVVMATVGSPVETEVAEVWVSSAELEASPDHSEPPTRRVPKAVPDHVSVRVTPEAIPVGHRVKAIAAPVAFATAL